VGTYLDAMDSTNDFILSNVIAMSTTQCTVHFDGWSDKWNLVRPIFDLILVLNLDLPVEIVENSCFPFVALGLLGADQGGDQEQSGVASG
jgi:hypothetical protein